MANDITSHSFSQQILLYAKNWYGKSGNIIEDLKILFTEWSDIPTEFITDRDIHTLLVDAFVEYVSLKPFDHKEALQEMLGWRWGRSNSALSDRKPEEVMIGKLSVVDGKYVNKSLIRPDIQF